MANLKDIKWERFHPSEPYGTDVDPERPLSHAWAHGPGAFYCNTGHGGSVHLFQGDWIGQFPGERVVVSDAIYHEFFTPEILEGHYAEPQAPVEELPPPAPQAPLQSPLGTLYADRPGPGEKSEKWEDAERTFAPEVPSEEHPLAELEREEEKAAQEREKIAEDLESEEDGEESKSGSKGKKNRKGS